jgi:hypothetical protein
MSAAFPKPQLGKRYRFTGFESAGFRNIPSDVIESKTFYRGMEVQSSGPFGFYSWFEVGQFQELPESQQERK